MSQKDRSTLKANFEKGKTPGEDQFSDLIDSYLNLEDDGIYSLGTDNLGIGSSNKHANLSVFGNMAVAESSSGASSDGLYVYGNTGIGGGMQTPAAQLAVSGGVYIGDSASTDPGDYNLQVDGNIISGGNLFADTATIGTSQGSAAYTLHVEGSFKATGNVTLEDNLTLPLGSAIATAQVQAMSGESLVLTNNSGNGLSIADSPASTPADVSTFGNLKLAGSTYIEAHQVQAKSSGTLDLTNNGTVLTIESTGAVTIDGDLKLDADLTLPDDIITRHSYSESSIDFTGRNYTNTIDTQISESTHFIYGLDWDISNVVNSSTSSSYYPRPYNISTLLPYIDNGSWYIKFDLINVGYNIDFNNRVDLVINYYAIKLNYSVI